MVNCFDSDDDDDDDDILLNAAPTFSKRRSRRAEDKSVENGFAKLRDALKKSDRQQKSETKIRRIKREMPEIADEDDEDNNYFLAKVESIAQQAASNKKPKLLCSDSWMVASEDMDDSVVPIKELIARASARNTYGATKSGAREIFNRSSSASETDSRLDPMALLENCLQKLEASHKLRSKVHTEFIRPIRAAMKASHLNSFLKSGYLERVTPPSEFMLWLCQVATSEPGKGYESKELCEQAFFLVTKLWKDYLASFGTKLLNIADLVPQLENFTCGPSIALRLSKFLQIWGLASRCGVGIAPDVNLGDAVRSCVVALIRAGIDQVFHDNSARSLLSDLRNLICGLIDLACPTEACDDDWMKETALKVLCVENFGPSIATGDASYLLSVALAVDIMPIKGSRHAAELKAFMAIRSLQICLCASDWESKVQAVLTSWQEDELANNKITTSLCWKAFASAYVTVTELMDSSATAEKDGPRLLAVLQIVTSCLEAVFALTQNAGEVEVLYQALPKFEHNILVLSKVSQHNKLDSHFSSAEHKLELLKRLCQSSRLRMMTPTAVKIQTSMFDFLTPKPQTPFDRNDTPIDEAETPIDQTETLADCKETPVDQTMETPVDCKEIPVDQTTETPVEIAGDHVEALVDQTETTGDHVATPGDQKEVTGDHVETSPGLKVTTGDHIETSPGLKENTGDHVETSPGLQETTGDHTPMDETEPPINHMEASVDCVDMPIDQTETTGHIETTVDQTESAGDHIKTTGGLTETPSALAPRL